jgi:hypothetical protein
MGEGQAPPIMGELSFTEKAVSLVAQEEKYSNHGLQAGTFGVSTTIPKSKEQSIVLIYMISAASGKLTS